MQYRSQGAGWGASQTGTSFAALPRQEAADFGARPARPSSQNVGFL